MSTLWMNHFQNHGSSGELVQGEFAENGGFAISNANPRRAGGKHLRATTGGYNNRLRRVFGDAKPDGAGVGYGLWVDQLPEGEDMGTGFTATILFAWLAANDQGQMVVMLGSDGGLILCRGWDYPDLLNGGGISFIKRVAPCVQAGAYNTVEGKCVADPASGVVEVRVNNRVRLTYTGNTDPAGTGEVSQMAWQKSSLSGTGVFDIADLHAWDTLAGEGAVDFCGNVGVLRRAPNADTAQADFALSTGGVGYSLLIDKTDGTYVQSDTVGDKSAFGAAAAPAGVTGIIAQQASWRGLKTDAGDCDIAGSFISGSDETDVVGQPMTEGETWRWQVSGTDPATAAPWTFSGANASTPAATRTL